MYTVESDVSPSDEDDAEDVQFSSLKSSEDLLVDRLFFLPFLSLMSCLLSFLRLCPLLDDDEVEEDFSLRGFRPLLSFSGSFWRDGWRGGCAWGCACWGCCCCDWAGCPSPSPGWQYHQFWSPSWYHPSYQSLSPGVTRVGNGLQQETMSCW